MDLYKLDIPKFNKKSNYFEFLLDVLELLNISKSLSKQLKWESSCHSLKLKYIQEMGDFFFFFEISRLKIEKSNDLYSNIEKIINVVHNENNQDKKNIEDCLKNTSIEINEIISVCEKNQSKNIQFINSINELSTSCKNDIKSITNDIERLKSEMEKPKYNIIKKILFFLSNFFSPINFNKIETSYKLMEIKQKTTTIDNINIIIKNFGSIENKIKLIIEFFVLVKNNWISINQRLENISNNLNNSNEWIFEKMNEILQNVNSLKVQLYSIKFEIKALEDNFNYLLFTKEANII